MCEDAINIINSKGKINEIKIFNSSYDSLDIDYSNISIEKMLINKAGNDCADFSFGNYKILESLVDNCSDKAFSFGEKSEGFVKNSLIKNSLNGVVSKDDSIVKIEDSKATEIKKFCLAAYNKKPEFEGGTIIKSNFVCTEQNKEYKDLKSNIQ